VVAIAIVYSSLGSGANPNQAEDIVRRSVANTNANWAAAPQYDFTERDSITRNGKRTTKTYRVSRQSEKFLIGQSRKFLLTAARLEGWNESR